MASPALKDSVKNPASPLPAAGSAVISAVVRPMLVVPEHERSSVQKAATVATLNVIEVADASPGLDASNVYVPGALSARFGKPATPSSVSTVVVPLNTADAEPGPRATVTLAGGLVTRAPAPSTTSTLTGGPGPYGVPVMVSPTRTFLGCVANCSLHCPEMVVVSELGATSVRSLPGGPLNPLACLARTPHVTTPELHAASATTVTVTELPGCSERFRSTTVLPETLAVPGPATDAERRTRPSGRERFAEPSCCCAPAGLLNVAENVVCEPAATEAGEMFTE